MRIAIDVMGSDLGPAEILRGAIRAARELPVGVTVVGREAELRPLLEAEGAAGLDLRLVDAPDVIDMEERNPAQAVRRRRESSMSVGVALVRHGDADAFVTAGHTGAAMTAATFGLGRIRGVERPALVSPFPAMGGTIALLDVGANVDVRPHYLQQFGILGAAYAERILGIERPRVGLITIGEEPGKGNEIVRAATPLLAGTELNFIGNVEGQDVALGNVDVAVTDGFTGNVMLKFAEGLGTLVGATLSQEARRDPMSALGGLLMRPAFRRMRARWSAAEYGGAMLLGVRGMVVIGHGSSDAAAAASMIRVAARGVREGLVEAMQSGVARGEADAESDTESDTEAAREGAEATADAERAVRSNAAPAPATEGAS